MAPKPHNYPNEPIAIVGSACRFPGGCSSPSKLWDLLQEPRDVLKEIPESRFNPNAFYHKDSQHHGTSNVRHTYLLDEDVRLFDAEFFGIKPVEASSVDPQQRLLLEVVYEGLERAGMPLENLQGSQTGVFVGVMSADYMELLARDIDDFPTYFASGTARSILSNRISYFFDWHGPSMTIDTACSSSLFALHLAVQSLRSGESSAAVVAGANLALSPEQYVAESKLKMLSPDSRSRMWDKDANGYARGDGIASLILKTVSQAIADGDHIEAVIRETGINQDGRTKGITMPSPTAQTDLIWSTYKRAGLDLSKASDRPQYFEAHGTGTPAGDPVEAEAISTAFFGPSVGFKRSNTDDPLYVGSIKTVIGHTEGTAGVAGIIKASLALQDGYLPPNLLLNEVNQNVKPFYTNLQILSQKKKWPTTEGAVRRVSINSFGFGGANAHAILESYDSPSRHSNSSSKEAPLCTFNFSAASEPALTQMLSAYGAYLRENPTVNLQDLSWSLNNRRSTLLTRLSVSASSSQNLAEKLDALSSTPTGVVALSSAAVARSKVPGILGIFTGQGAQWAAMGSHLLAVSKLAVERLESLQKSLNSLPEEHVPSWTLKEELAKDKINTRIGQAEFSQPLCTALQLILIDHLEAASVKFKALVGHSSGEIALAYAAGYMSAEDAIRIAYYRGYFLHLAHGPDGSIPGAMLAVGTTPEDAKALCELGSFEGRVKIAASNSPESLTLSGDRDALESIQDILADEGKFARLLKVDKAYHSHHMLPCAEPYIAALKNIGIQVLCPTAKHPHWISSVYGKDMREVDTQGLAAEYWSKNMVSQVLFSEAVEYAVGARGPFDFVIEVGPHPALKNPASDTIQAIAGETLPYTGVLRRDANDAEAFLSGLGTIWQWLGSGSVNFTDLQRKMLQGQTIYRTPKLLTNLPSYAWQHDRAYWHESRAARAYRTNNLQPHQILGSRLPDGVENEIRWKNYINAREIPWLVHHQVDRQVVFPAAGYISAVIEAVVQRYGLDKVNLVDFQNVVIGQALLVADNASVETLLSFQVSETKDDEIKASFSFYSASPKDPVGMIRNASGKLAIHIGASTDDVLPSAHKADRSFLDVDPDRFYTTVGEVGLGYTGPFRNLSGTRRRMGEAVGFIKTPDPEFDADERLVVHPSVLDCAIQSIILAYSFPGDGRLKSIYLPTTIDRVRINPLACVDLKEPSCSKVPFYSTVTAENKTDLSGDVEIHSRDGKTILVQLEGLRTTPLNPAAPSNDVNLFFETEWKTEAPTGNDAMWQEGAYHQDEYALSFFLERVAYYYIRMLDEAIPPDRRQDIDWHYKIFYEYVDHIVSWVAKGTHPFAKKEWISDSYEDITTILEQYPDSIDLRMMKAVGENMVAAIRKDINILEAMTKDDMLTSFYTNSLGMEKYLLDIARMIGQLSHCYPHLDVLEIGAGTGGATEMILSELKGSFGTYTYTDISGGFFEKAQDRFERHRSRMVFKVLDIEVDIAEQGYTPHSYDLVIASLVLHATRNLEDTMRNARKLLKPGGRLLLLELTDNDPIRFSFIFGGLPGWWLGYDDGRKLSPCVGIDEWETLMQKTGFTGIEAVTSHNRSFPLPLSVILTQATDERIELLRNPLASGVRSLGSDTLTIITGVSEMNQTLANDIVTYAGRHYKNGVIQLKSLTDLISHQLPFLATVVVLVDLDDNATFSELTEESLSAIKSVYKESKNVLWVTAGTIGDNPYRNMHRGLQRTIVKETSHVHVQLLDFASVSDIDSKVISKSLAQLEAGTQLEEEGSLSSLLWYREPEVQVKDGVNWVPRVRLSEKRNRRYNSGRRLVTEDVNLNESVASIRHNGTSFTLSKQATSHQCAVVNRVEVRLTHSLLHAIKFPDGSSLYLSAGKVVGTDERVIALSDALDSRVKIPGSWRISLSVSTDAEAQRALLSLYTHLLAYMILSDVSMGESAVVLDPGFFVGTALAKYAAEKAVNLQLLTSDAAGEILARPWISIHHRGSRKSLSRILCKSPVSFTNIGGLDHLTSAVVSCLPGDCIVRDQSAFLSPNARLGVGFPTIPTISNHLQSIWIRCAPDIVPSEAEVLPSINLAELIHTTSHLGQAVVSWISAPVVLLQMQPASKIVQFAKDKTYWMVGLTGGLGLSLCEWMARQGAKYIVLSSRNPQIEDAWLNLMADLGCTVRVFANDITNREAVRSLHRRITDSFPPIAGVAQGAMVLEDILFQNVDIARVKKVMSPKVDGSIHLNELFADTKLDFFVFFSSVAYVTGNAGQSIYGASSSFMASLAAKRRRHGQAASVINLGAILGAGYVSRELNLQQQEYLRKVGLYWMSEQDAHEIFAEGILASSPGSPLSHEFETGFRLDKDRAKDVVNEPPLLQHLGALSSEASVDQTKTKQIVKTKAKLLGATHPEEVFEILKDGFILKLQTALQTDASKPMLDVSLDELGADSLVAVDIRSWFLKELGVDVPVLKVLNAPSVRDLLKTVEELLPTETIPNLTGGVSKPGVPAPTGVADAYEDSSRVLVQSLQTQTISGRWEHITTQSQSVSESLASLSTAESTRNSSNPETMELPELLPKDAGYHKTGAEETCKIQREVPLSFAQARFWFLKHYVQDQTAFNITTVIGLKGELRVADLDKALSAVVQRHEALRTSFITDLETKQPRQVVLNASPVKVKHVTISAESELEHHMRQVKQHIFNIEDGESLLLKVISLSANQYWIVLGYHHIYMDGIGYVVFLNDLEKAYNGVLGQTATDAIQYPDFTLRQRSEYETGAWSRELSYWHDQFATLPDPFPLLPLAGASARPKSSQFGSHSTSFRIDAEVELQIVAVCRRFKVTPFHFYLAAFGALLRRYAGQTDDLCIGVADGNRKDADVLESLGIFLNVLPLRLKIAARQTFADTLKHAKTIAQAAFSNSRVPFDVLLKELDVPRVPSHSPLFQVFLNYRQNQQEARRFLGCDGQLDIIATGQTDYDVGIDVLDLSGNGGQSLVIISVQKGLYDVDAVNVLASSFKELLHQLVNNPAAQVGMPSLYAKNDVRSAIVAGIGLSLPSKYPTILHRIDAISSRYPERVALKGSKGNSFTYAALNSRVNAICTILNDLNLGRGSIIGVHQARGPSWIVSVLAILRVGAAYVPLEPELGFHRLSLITEDCQPAAILADSESLETDIIQQTQNASVIVNVTAVADYATFQNLPNMAEPSSIAAVIYSSGSTGTPKGVALTHANISNYVEVAPSQWGLVEGEEVFLNSASYSFDVSLQQTIVALSLGGTVVVVDGPSRGDPTTLSELILSEGITVTGATPTEYLTWARHWNSKCLQDSAWKVAFTWGEPVSWQEIASFKQLNKPGLRLIDGYGPAEATITCAHGNVDWQSFETDSSRDSPQFPLEVIPNCSVRIVDESLKPVPTGVLGEIVIAGAPVARGYLNADSNLNAEKFISDEHADENFLSKGWITAHRTGDRGRLRPDGRIILSGRLESSTQVKLAGIRVDVREIESNILRANPSILQSVVSVRKSNESDQKYLVAFVELSNKDLNPAERERLLEGLPGSLELPQYMLPALVIEVGQLPVNSSGKLDRRAVNQLPVPTPPPEDTQPTATTGVLTSTEESLRELWRQALPADVVQHHAIYGSSDFFHVGGSSLSLINLQALIKERLGVVVSLYQLFQTSTLGGMARLTQGDESSSAENIDWDAELALPDTLASIPSTAPWSGTPTVVGLTGSTGFLGKEILRQLVDDNQITLIHCLAVRKKRSDLPDALFSHEKVIIHPGDLGLPHLGLAPKQVNTLFGEGPDRIGALIHAGADVSFMKTYSTLRLTNVASTKELVSLTAANKIPFHFVSSATVSRLAIAGGRDSFGRESIEPYPPKMFGSADTDGYVAAKWVSEVLLERAASKFGLPVWIHRPSSVTGEDTSDLDLISNITKYVHKTKTIPDTRGWGGQFDYVSVQTAARDILRDVFANQVSEERVRFRFQSGETVLAGEQLQDALEKETGSSFTVLPFRAWINLAQNAGMSQLLTLYLRRAEGGQLLIPKILKD